MVTNSINHRDALLKHLGRDGIHAVFHYLPLHSSQHGTLLHDGRELPNTDRFSQCIIRLPFFSGLTEAEVESVARSIRKFYEKQTR